MTSIAPKEITCDNTMSSIVEIRSSYYRCDCTDDESQSTNPPRKKLSKNRPVIIFVLSLLLHAPCHGFIVPIPIRLTSDTTITGFGQGIKSGGSCGIIPLQISTTATEIENIVSNIPDEDIFLTRQSSSERHVKPTQRSHRLASDCVSAEFLAMLDTAAKIVPPASQYFPTDILVSSPPNKSMERPGKSTELKPIDTAASRDKKSKRKSRNGKVSDPRTKKVVMKTRVKTKRKTVKDIDLSPPPEISPLEFLDGSYICAQTANPPERSGLTNVPNLHRYYSELLTAREEYELGTSVQMLVGCEAVYEGLVLKLGGAHPTIAAWASACGYTNHDQIDEDACYQEQFVEEHGLRPKRSNVNIAGKINRHRRNNRFDRNIPPAKLQDFRNDSHLLYRSDGSKRRKPLVGKGNIINRGTTSEFVEKLVSAREAKQKMIQCNMRLVTNVAKRYTKVGVSMNDLVQEGSMGLARAAEKYEPRRGFRFSTYATWWIQQAIYRSIAYHSRTIRLPAHVHSHVNLVRRSKTHLQTILERTPTHEEVAKEINMPTEKYIKMQHLTLAALSLDIPKYRAQKDGSSSDLQLIDTMHRLGDYAKNEPTPEKKFENSLFHKDLKEMYKVLKEDERMVMEARYGFEHGETHTVNAVAEKLGQPIAWVRSVECRALRKLRRPWYAKILWEHQIALHA